MPGLKIACVLLICLIGIGEGPHKIWGQPVTIDSLQTELQQEVSPESAASIYLALSKAYWNLHLDSALRYAEKALDISQQLKDEGLLAETHANFGAIYYLRANYESSKDAILRATPYFVKTKNNSKLGRLYNNLALVYAAQGEYPEGLNFHQKALDYRIQANDKQGESDSYNNIAIIHRQQGQYAEALAYYFQAARLKAQLGDSVRLASIYNNLGNVYRALRDYHKADHYLDRSLAIYQTAQLPRKIALNLDNRGELAFDQKLYEEAGNYFQQALKLRKSIEDRQGWAVSLMHMGKVHFELGKDQAALEAFETALDVFEEVGAKSAQAECQVCLAAVYWRLRQYTRAFSEVREGLDLAKSVGQYDTQVKGYHYLAEILSSQGNHAAALLAFRQYSSLHDSLFHVQDQQRWQQMQVAYEREKQQQEITFLQKENELNSGMVRRQFWLIVTLFIGLGLAVGLFFLYFRYNEQKKQLNVQLEQHVEERTQALVQSNQELATANLELERLTYITSHDLKEPLRNISGFLGLLSLRLKDQLNEEQLEYLQYAIAGAKDMNRLLSDIQEMTSTRNHIPYWEKVDLGLALKEVGRDLAPLISERNAKIEYSKLPKIETDRLLVKTLFHKLVKNGIVFNRTESPKVKIHWSNGQDQYQFRIADNGIGIDPQYQAQIFEPFRRLHNRSTYAGSGLGLAICKRIVGKLNGQINLGETTQQGSVFVVSLPRNPAQD